MDSEIKGITFLTAAKVVFTDWTEVVQVDMVNRKVFWKNGDRWGEELEDQFFAHIQESTKLPDDLFSAPQDALENAMEAQAEHASMRGQQLGE